MSTTINRRRTSNPVQFGTMGRWLLTLFVVGAAGLFYVHVKNQQFALGEEIRQVERRIKQVRADNEVLLARITELSSRRALQQRIAEGFISVKPIQDNQIARLVPPAEDDGRGISTAFNSERPRQ